jgi:hypothetical protein
VPAYICRTCGVQYPESGEPQAECVICLDERQYIGWGGQQWTTLERMREEGHQNRIQSAATGLEGIDTRPRFAIGQRALLVRTDAGNMLWDCISYIDDETTARVRELGGIAAISVSHPHFYGVMVEWSRAFGAPIYLPEADRQWVVRDEGAVRWYTGSVEPVPGLTLVQCGGHFEGSAVLHWAAGADGKGALLTGDSISVAQDRRWVTFMRSYPNYIPMSPSMVRSIVAAVEPCAFDAIYGGWWGSEVRGGAKDAVRRSAERYIEWAEHGVR